MTGNLILKAQMKHVSLNTAQTKENAIKSKIEEIESTELVALHYKRTGIDGDGLINFNVKIGNVNIVDSVTKLSIIVNKIEGIINVSILQYKFEEGRQ